MVKNDVENDTTCMMCKMHEAMHTNSMCGACGGMNHFFVIRIVLMLALLTFVFWAGMQFGNMTNERSGYDQMYGHMGRGFGGGYPQMMMYGNDGGYSNGYAQPLDATYSTDAVPVAVPATAGASATKVR